MIKMENKQKNKENRADQIIIPTGGLEALISDAKQEWGKASGGRVKDCQVNGGSLTRLNTYIYLEDSNLLLILKASNIRVNKGEYVIHDGSTNFKSSYPDKMKVYSPNLEYQFSYNDDSGSIASYGGAFIDGDGCYRNGAGSGGHSAG